MAYSDFTLESASSKFGLALNQEVDLFTMVPAVAVSSFLRTVLDEFIPLGTSIHTEKARSEFIVAPILAEARRLMNHGISLFSGVDFNVDFGQGLNGTCDFILAASRIQLFVQNPVLMVVEAKNDNIKAGLGQCAAEMLAARIFNEREGQSARAVHGAVTTGTNWRFLKLDGATLFIDRTEYYLDQVERILGILLHCVGGEPAKPALVA
jgi:hypothetical protein